MSILRRLESLDLTSGYYAEIADVVNHHLTNPDVLGPLYELISAPRLRVSNNVYNEVEVLVFSSVGREIRLYLLEWGYDTQQTVDYVF